MTWRGKERRKTAASPMRVAYLDEATNVFIELPLLCKLEGHARMRQRLGLTMLSTVLSARGTAAHGSSDRRQGFIKGHVRMQRRGVMSVLLTSEGVGRHGTVSSASGGARRNDWCFVNPSNGGEHGFTRGSAA